MAFHRHKLELRDGHFEALSDKLICFIIIIIIIIYNWGSEQLNWYTSGRWS